MIGISNIQPQSFQWLTNTIPKKQVHNTNATADWVTQYQQRHLERMFELIMREVYEKIVGDLLRAPSAPNKRADALKDAFNPNPTPEKRRNGDDPKPEKRRNDDDPTPAASGKVQDFLQAAKAKQGAPYVFGAEGNGRYDCSGLVYASLKEAGVNVPRLTAEGYRKRFADSAVSRDELKPGDLVFFHTPNDRGIPAGKATHIEIYLGNGMTMGTDNPAEGARIERINWNSFIGGARVPQLSK